MAESIISQIALPKSKDSIPAHRMIAVGTAGEHIVCADLILAGHRAFLTSAGLPYDVIADIGGMLFRIAVKSTTVARPRAGRTLTRSCYQFNILRSGKRPYTSGEADLVALVALDRRLVCYLPVAKCPTIMHLDEPGPIHYPNHKGPKRGRCKIFADFPLTSATDGCKQ
jgi:hypothetical protein